MAVADVVVDYGETGTADYAVAVVAVVVVVPSHQARGVYTKTSCLLWLLL